MTKKRMFIVKLTMEEEIDPARFEEWCEQNAGEWLKVEIFDKEANVRVFKW